LPLLVVMMMGAISFFVFKEFGSRQKLPSGAQKLQSGALSASVISEAIGPSPRPSATEEQGTSTRTVSAEVRSQTPTAFASAPVAPAASKPQAASAATTGTEPPVAGELEMATKPEEPVTSKGKASAKKKVAAKEKAKAKVKAKTKPKEKAEAKAKAKAKAKPKPEPKSKVDAKHDARMDKLKAASDARKAKQEEERRQQEEEQRKQEELRRQMEEERKVAQMRVEMEKAAAAERLEAEKREHELRRQAMEMEMENEKIRKKMQMEKVRQTFLLKADKADMGKFFRAFVDFFNWNTFYYAVAHFYERRHGRILFAVCLRWWRTIAAEKKKEHGRFAEARYTAARALQQRALKGDMELGIRKRQVMDHFTMKVVLTRWHGLIVDSRNRHAEVAEKKDPLKSQSTRWAHWAADVTSASQLRDLAVPVHGLPSLSDLYRGKTVDPAPPPLPPQAGWEEIAGPLPGSHSQILRVVSDGDTTQFISEAGSNRQGNLVLPAINKAEGAGAIAQDSAVSHGAAAYGRNLVQVPGLSPRPGMVVRSPTEGRLGEGGMTPGVYSKSGGYPRFGT